MRVWLYYRLSRDEDEELNSLMNQRSIIESYALSHGHTIVGESCDDNISGMHFDRDGIEQLTEAVDAGLIDAVIVKDLSRLGRHRTQTALYITAQSSPIPRYPCGTLIPCFISSIRPNSPNSLKSILQVFLRNHKIYLPPRNRNPRRHIHIVQPSDSSMSSFHASVHLLWQPMSQ